MIEGTDLSDSPLACRALNVYGEVAERSIAAQLECAKPPGFKGSNPFLSAEALIGEPTLTTLSLYHFKYDVYISQALSVCQ